MAAQQYEQELLEQIREFLVEEIKEVLDFAAFLRQRRQREQDRLQEERERAAKRMDERRKRIGSVNVQAADLVEEGRTARMAEILREGNES